jgi:hypothetical protein
LRVHVDGVDVHPHREHGRLKDRKLAAKVGHTEVGARKAACAIERHEGSPYASTSILDDVAWMRWKRERRLAGAKWSPESLRGDAGERRFLAACCLMQSA